MRNSWIKFLAGLALGVMCLSLGAPPKRRSENKTAAVAGVFDVPCPEAESVAISSVLALIMGAHFDFAGEALAQAHYLTKVQKTYGEGLGSSLNLLYGYLGDSVNQESAKKLRARFPVILRHSADYFNKFPDAYRQISNMADIFDKIGLDKSSGVGPVSLQAYVYPLKCALRTLMLIDFDAQVSQTCRARSKRAARVIFDELRAFEASVLGFKADVEELKVRGIQLAARREARRQKAECDRMKKEHEAIQHECHAMYQQDTRLHLRNEIGELFPESSFDDSDGPVPEDIAARVGAASFSIFRK